MLNITRPAALFFLLLVCSNSYTQNSTSDSLKVLLQNPKLHDTTRLSIMSEIIGYYKVGDAAITHYNVQIKQILDKGLSKKGISKKERNAYKFALAYWYCDKSSEIFSKKNASRVITYYDRAIAIFKELELEDEVWFTVNNKGYALRKLNLYNEAIACFFGALKHHEQSGNTLGVAAASMALASVYDDLDQYQKSLFYDFKALGHYNAVKKPTNQDLYEQAVLLGNIGNCYYNLKQSENAKIYYNKSIKIHQQIGNDASVGFGLRNLANIDFEEKNYDAAIQKYKEGLSLTTNGRSKAYLLNGLGIAYFRLNNIPEAKKYLEEGAKHAAAVNEYDVLWPAYKYLHQLYKSENNYKQSLDMLEKYNSITDSMNVESSKNALMQQQLKYDFEKRELNYKLATEKKNADKNNLLIMLSATLILLLLGGWFYYRNIKQKQAITVLEKDQIKQKLLITQMNPHFIFNSIENIQGLIYNKQGDAAVNYLNKFSALTRQILENSNENYISLAEEVDMIKNYLSIQQLLYNNKFDFSINVNDEIDTDTIFLPPMLTQPFIENAIKHGLSNKTENGTIDIRFYLKDLKLYFEILDNGKGFEANKNATNHKSLAMAITKERLVTYTKNRDFTVQTENIIGTDNDITGAKVIFEIPYIYEN